MLLRSARQHRRLRARHCSAVIRSSMAAEDLLSSQPLVLDNGSGTLKAGFAGSERPKLCVATSGELVGTAFCSSTSCAHLAMYV